MNAKKARAARRASTPPAAPARSRWLSRRATVAAAAVAVVSAGFVTPKLLDGPAAAPAAMSGGTAMSVEPGTGLSPGSRVPAFSERDVRSGRPITDRSLRGKTLLFFSEGVMCQACLEQIKGLERIGSELAKREITLVSVTPDSAADLEQAVRLYGIRTPMIADPDRSMSAAFNTLGRGMHGDAPGHAFALIEKGRVRAYRDYWLAPDRTMYVDPERILADLPRARSG